MDVYVLTIGIAIVAAEPGASAGIAIATYKTEEQCRSAIDAIEFAAHSLNPSLEFDCKRASLQDGEPGQPDKDDMIPQTDSEPQHDS